MNTTVLDLLRSLDMHIEIKEIKDLEAKNAKREKALEFYADKLNWSKTYLRQGKVCKQARGLLAEDGGDIAQKALEETGLNNEFLG